MLVSVPAAETLETIFTSIVLFPFVASVETPVMIPFRYPLNVDVEPAPAKIAEIFVVTPYPINAPKADTSVVLIPILWSARSSITQTFRLFAQEPGFFAA